MKGTFEVIKKTGDDRKVGRCLCDCVAHRVYGEPQKVQMLCGRESSVFFVDAVASGSEVRNNASHARGEDLRIRVRKEKNLNVRPGPEASNTSLASDRRINQLHAEKRWANAKWQPREAVMLFTKAKSCQLSCSRV